MMVDTKYEISAWIAITLPSVNQNAVRTSILVAPAVKVLPSVPFFLSLIPATQAFNVGIKNVILK
jgi:hypothetical protein